MEIYEKTVEVLAPEVNKLLNLMYFQVRISIKKLIITFDFFREKQLKVFAVR